MAAHVASPGATRAPRSAYVITAVAGTALLAAGVLDLRPAWLLVAMALAAALAASIHWLAQWKVLISSICLCVLLVPIARYTLPFSLPFAAEPYQLLLAAIAVVWLLCLLAQSAALRWHPTGIGAPLIAVIIVIALSIAVNLPTIHARGVSQDVVFKVTFFTGFFVLMLMIGNVLRTRAELDAVIKTLVAGGAVVGLMTLIENKTGFNAFDHLQQVFPLLRFQSGGVPGFLESRGSGFRVYGSAQHPLALGAALVTVLPLGLYLGIRTKQRIWWAAAAVIGIAAFATVARTAVMMLMIEVLVLVCLKPHALRRFWWIVPPFLVAVNIAVPATLGTLKASFFPQGGLVAQQSTTPGGDASNRVADLGPSLEEAKRTPFVGQGWGTRLPDHLDPAKSNRYLDNQWLGILLEAGWLGVLAWIWFFGRNIRLLAGAALRDDSEYGWLLAGLAASVFAFAVGMFTYDAFGFSQATLLMFITVGLGIAARRLAVADAPAPAQPAG